MSDNRYNGWANYETWNVNLWLTNDEGTYSMLTEAVEEVCRDADDRTDAEQALADRIAAMCDEFYFAEALEACAGPAADLLGAAISSINYREIADHYVSDYVSENPEAFAAEVEE